MGIEKEKVMDELSKKECNKLIKLIKAQDKMNKADYITIAKLVELSEEEEVD